MRTLIILSVLLALALPASAKEAQNRRLLEFAANNVSFDKNVDAQAKDVFKRQFPGCPQIEQVVRQLPEAYGDLSFPPALKPGDFPPPKSGLWVERVKIRGCERVRQINMLSVAQNDGGVVMLALLPGDTHADPAIQREAERIGAIAITKADATCSDSPSVVYTRFVGYRDAEGALGPTDAGHGWFEAWDYRFCQKDVTAQISFTPEEEGALDIKARVAGATQAAKPAAKPSTLPEKTPEEMP